MARDRARMTEELNQRVEQSYETRDNASNFTGSFIKDTMPPLWVPANGEHEFDIIPYYSGNQDPSLSPDKFTHKLEYKSHRDVGPAKVWFLCPVQFGKACPICEHREEIRTDPPTDKNQIEGHEQMVKDLYPRRRMLYNIVCYDSEEEEDKGIQAWEISHHYSEKELMVAAKLPKKMGGGYISFAHPDIDKGQTILLDRSGEGRKSKYVYKFVKRDYEISDELLDAAYTLDELLYLPTHKEIYDAYWDKSGEEAVEEEPDPDRDYARRERPAENPVEEPTGRRKRMSQTTTTVAIGELKCPLPGGTFGVDHDDFDGCDTCDIWNECAKAKVTEPTEEEPKEEPTPEPRRKRKAQPVEDAPQKIEVDRYKEPTAEQEPEEEPAPRRTRKPQRVETEEASAPRRKRGPRKVTEEEEDDIPV